jgi:hypothetical protein
VAGNESSALDRARADLAAGRPDLARDRVQGYLHTLALKGEYSAETYVLLGDIFFAMRDFARAGGAWILTDRDDDCARLSFEAFTQRYGKKPANILDAVKPRAPSENYPPAVQERLKSWGYRYLPHRTRTQKRAAADESDEAPQSGLRPIEAGCVVTLIVGFVLLCMYLYSMFFGHGR